jgi:hypothetical protein
MRKPCGMISTRTFQQYSSSAESWASPVVRQHGHLRTSTHRSRTIRNKRRAVRACSNSTGQPKSFRRQSDWNHRCGGTFEIVGCPAATSWCRRSCRQLTITPSARLATANTSGVGRIVRAEARRNCGAAVSMGYSRGRVARTLPRDRKDWYD